MTPCEKLEVLIDMDSRFSKGDIVEFKEPAKPNVHEGYGWYYNITKGNGNYCGHESWFKSLKPEWDGTGTPPVGTECTATLNGGAHEFDIRVTYSVKEVVCGEIINPAHGFASGTISPFDTSIYSFKPLRTERDKAVDDMTSVSGIFTSQAEKLYDAGYRKPQHKEG